MKKKVFHLILRTIIAYMKDKIYIYFKFSGI